MGCVCCCCAKPCPPIDPAITGTWVNVPEAIVLHQPGIHWHRYETGYGLWAKRIQLPSNSSSQILIKLYLDKEGWICYKFVNMTDGFHRLIDTTVGSWNDGKITTNVCGAALNYTIERSGRETYLNIDGYRLQKSRSS